MDIVAYGEYYNQAMQGLADMLLQEGCPLDSFKRSLYPEAFQAYLRRYIGVIDAIEKVYLKEDGVDEEWLDKLVDHLIVQAQESLAQISRKGKRNERLVDYNMILAVYVIPAILEQKGQSADPLADRIVEKWNTAFATAIGKSSYEKIEEGFHKKFCYITTAVCESQGKADDCYELSLLRSYRDQYLLFTKEGAELVKEYYNIAPTIVTRISRLEHAAQVYEGIWQDYLSPCIRFIEQGKLEACREQYMAMVYELKGRYMA